MWCSCAGGQSFELELEFESESALASESMSSEESSESPPSGSFRGRASDAQQEELAHGHPLPFGALVLDAAPEPEPKYTTLRELTPRVLTVATDGARSRTGVLEFD